MGYGDPIPIYFPDYKEDDLCQIFMRYQANRKLYYSFFNENRAALALCRITRQVDELSTALKPLFDKYCEPLNDLSVVPNEDMARRLFSHLEPHIKSSLNEIFMVPSPTFPEVEANNNTMRNGNAKKIDFNMSICAKYLLISAFLASRNPATLDASLFYSKGGSGNQKRKRKPSEKALEQKETAEQELVMKGPGTFPLERLLAIFQCITSVAEDSIEEEGERNYELGVQEGDGGLMSDVPLQLSSLCNASFIVKVGSCPLEGSMRYRTTVSEDLAEKQCESSGGT
ncbi:Origin recognition complex subunit 5 [Quillaja saponaria]|uniref:Origin recognition complex subunit 5 n=1 Tax=Quillaja saponaria TaxID=32244 RepID=A0AAD7L5B7_QUISA|nr:Origin recognition complex subunit 5 [Quillaja saponaria]